MKKFLFLAVLFSSVSAFAGNGQCTLCEINRENNKKNVNPYPYYEDYLEAQKKGGAAPAAAPAAPAAPAAAPAAPAKI
jgi:hypothetical protein